MAGFLTQNQKENIKSIIDRIHETFARDITVFKIGTRTAISSSQNYNFIYRQQSTNTETTEVFQTFKARIKYVSAEEQLLPDGNAGQDKIILPAGSVKIKVDINGYNYLKEAKRVEFDGFRFSIKSDGKPLGMFGPQYYEFLLLPIDE